MKKKLLITVCTVAMAAIAAIAGTDYTIDGGTTNASGTADGGAAPQLSIVDSGSAVTASGSWNLSAGDTLNITGGSLTVSGYDGTTDVLTNGIITASAGTITLNGGQLILAGGSSISDTVTTAINAGTLNLTGGSFVINSGDTWTGTVNNAGGTLTISDVTKSGIFSQTSGTTTFSSAQTIDTTDSITGGIIAVSGGVTLTNNNLSVASGIENSGTIDGEGNWIVNANSTNTGSITQNAITINDGISFETSADGITTSTNTITNNGTLTLKDGTNANAISGTGATTIDGTVVSNASIGGSGITVNENKQLTIAAANIGADVDNKGKVIVDGTGTLGQSITDVQTSKTGVTDIKGTNVSLASGETIVQKALNILAGGKLTAAADAVTAADGIASAGTLVLTGGDDAGSRITNSNAVTAYETTKGDVEFSGFIANDAAITANNIKNTGNLVNNSAKTLTGAVDNDGTLTANADDIAGTVDNSGTYNVTGGTIGYNISDTAGTGILSTSNGVIIAAEKSVTQKTLTVAGTLTNNGILTVNGDLSGTSTPTINGTGNINLDGGTAVDDVITNAVTINSGGDVSIGGFVDNTSGSITANDISIAADKYLKSNAATLIETNDQSIANAGTLELTGGTNANAITGAGKTIVSGEVTQTSGKSIDNTTGIEVTSTGVLTANAGDLDAAISNIGAISLTAGTLEQAISGVTGTYGNLTTADGVGIANVAVDVNNLTTAGTLANAGTLTIHNALTNGGTISNSNALKLVGGTAPAPITNAGTISGTGSITIGDGTNAAYAANTGLISQSVTIAANGNFSTAGVDNPDAITSGLNAAVTNNGALTLTGGTVVGAVTGSGVTTIDGTVVSNASIGGSGITVNGGKQLTIAATNIGADVNNKGKIIIDGTGTIGKNIGDTQENKTGITDIKGTNVVLASGKTIAQKALNILTGGKLTAVADAVQTDDGVVNAGTYVLTGGTSESYKANASAISGAGTTEIGDGTNAAYVSNSKAIEQNVTVKANANFDNQAGGSITGTTTVNTGAVATNSAGTLGVVSNAGTLNVLGGTVTSITNTAGSTQGVFQSGGVVTTVANTGSYNLTGGTVTNYGQTSGDLNISNNASLTLTSGNKITGGTVNLGKASPVSIGTLVINNGASDNAAKVVTTGESVLNIQNGTLTTSAETDIGNAAVVTIGTADATNGALKVTAGEVTLGGNDNWNAKGAVTVDGGTLNLGGVTQSGSLTQTSGTTNISAAQALGTGASITGGTLNVNNDLTLNAGSTVTAGSGNASVKIASNKNLNIAGGTVTLNGNSGTSKTYVDWAGDVNLSSGSLTLKNIYDTSRNASGNKSGRLNAIGGSLNIDNSTVLLGNNDVIAKAVALTLTGDLIVTSSANAYVDSTDSWTAGDITQSGGILTLDGVTTAAGKTLSSNGGTLNILNNVTLATTSDAIATATVINLASGNTLTINNSTTAAATDGVVFDTGDTWAGTIAQDGGQLTLKGRTDETTSTKKLTMTNGKLVLDGSSLTLKSGSSITGGTVSIDPSSLVFDNNTDNSATILMNVDDGSSLTIKGADITVPTNPVPTTLTLLSDSDLDYGNVTVGDGTYKNVLNIANNSSVAAAVNMEIKANAIANLSDTAALTINTGDVWNGKLNQTAGTLTVLNDDYTKTTGYLTSTGGSIVIGDTDTPISGTLLVNNVSDSIAAATTVDIKANSVLSQSAGSVILNAGDTWGGKIELSSNGNLTLSGRDDTTTANSRIKQSGGTLNITDTGKLVLNTSDSDITGTSNIVLGEGTGNTAGTLVINNGVANQAKVTNAGTSTSSSFTVKGANTSFTTLTDTNFTKGSVTVGDGTNASVLNLSNNGIIAKEVALKVDTASTMNVAGTSKATINTGDIWNGTINQTAGTLNILDNVVKAASTAKLTSNGGTLNIGDGATIAGILNLNNSNDSIATATTVVINNNGTLNETLGSVVLDNADTWNGAISLGGGSLELVGRADTTTGTKTYNQTAGTLTIDNGGSLTLATNASKITETSNVVLGEGTGNTKGTLILQNSSDNVAQLTTAGTNNNVLTVGDGNNATTLKLINNSEIAKKEVVTIAANSKLEVNGTAATGQGVNLNGGTTGADTWNGDVKVTGGTLNISGNMAKAATGTLTQNSGTGTTNIVDTFTFGNNDNDVVTAGTLNIGDGVGTNDTALTVAGGTITAGTGKAKVVINSDSTMNIIDGTVTLDGGSSFTNMSDSQVQWQGAVTLNGGSLILKNIIDETRAAAATPTKYNKQGLLTANTGSLSIDNTTVLLGNGDLIADAVNLTLTGDIYVGKDNGDSTYDTATVYIGRDDTGWTAGSVNLVNNGILTLNGITTNDTTKYVNAESGTLTLLDNKTGSGSGNTFNNANDKILYAVNTTLNSPLNINAGKIQLNDADTLTSGKITLNGGELDLAGVSTVNNQLVATTGTLKIESNTAEGKTTTLNNATGDSIAEAVAMTIASGSTLKVNGENANVKVSANDAWYGNLVLNNGNVEIMGARTDSTTDSKTYVQDGGTLTIGGGSSLTLNTVTGVSSKITDGSSVVLGEGTGNTAGTLVINNGLTTNQAKVTNAGTSTSSSFTVKGAGTAFTTLTGTNFTKGSVTVGDGTNASVLNVSNNAIIADAVALTINAGTTGTDVNTLNLNGATAKVTINTGDTWNGALNQTNGTLTVLNNVAKGDNGYLNATSGTLNIGDGATAGTLNLNNANDLIAKAVVTTIYSDSTLQLSKVGAQATINGDGATPDNWAGAIQHDNGILTIDTINATTGANQKYNQAGGKATLTATNLKLATGASKITDGAVDLTNTSTLTLSNATANTAAITMAAATETLAVTDSTALTLDSYTYDLGGAGETLVETNISAGTVNVGNAADNTDASALNVASGKIAKAANVSVYDGAALNITGADASDETAPAAGDAIVAAVTLDGTDVWDGAINISNTGVADHKNVSLTLDGITKTIGADSAAFTQSGGLLELINNTQFTINDLNVSTITDGDFKIDDSSKMIIKKGAYTTRHHQTSGLIDIMNGEITTNKLTGNMAIANGVDGDGQANFKLDFNARSTKQSDKFLITGNMTTTDNTQKAVVYVEDWQIQNNESPIEESITYNVFNAGAYDNNISYTATQKEVLTPIGYYKLRGLDSGKYQLYLSRFNPKVFRGAVATSAMYAGQLSINNMLFDHINFISQGIDDKFINKTSALDPVFAPYQYSKKDGAIWFKPYGNFETLSLTQGLNVHNNTYGALVGVDLPYRELKRGWGLITTPYIGYNGGHQTYDGTSLWQNGGQIGVMNSFFKDNFMSSLSVYGGVYGNSMSMEGTTDDTFNAFAGVASKTAYNINLPASFVLQPTFLFSYNWFSKQNWSTDYGSMSMKTGMLNGINIAPGANLIWKKKTFSIYLTLQYMFNINDKIDGKAGNVTLPDLRMRHNGYIEYGVGATKTFKDRLSTYVQLTFRNIGRTGIGVQGGLGWRL